MIKNSKGTNAQFTNKGTTRVRPPDRQITVLKERTKITKKRKLSAELFLFTTTNN